MRSSRRRTALRLGEVCGKARAPDVVDVSVVVGAARRKDHIVTSDVADIARIAAHVPGVAGIIRI